MKWLIVLALGGCACPKPAAQAGTGSDQPPVKTPTTCDELRPKLEALYRAEAEAKAVKNVPEAVADNTAMVLGDCAKAPATAVACLNAATTLAELEAKCLAPIDDQGSEGAH